MTDYQKGVSDTVDKAARYRKKPIEVEAFRLGIDCMPDWFMDALSANTVKTYNRDRRWSGGPDYASIKTLEGEMVAVRGDWVIKGVMNELYPCKPRVFEATYELVDEQQRGFDPLAGEK